jgi:hypothetical protein
MYRLVSLVATFCPQSVLVVPDVVSVPWEEEGRSVVPGCLLDVHDNVIVKSALCSRGGGGRQGRLGLQA